MAKKYINTEKPNANAEVFERLDNMMESLMDNVNNDISAEDIRRSIFTLWNKIDESDESDPTINVYKYTNPLPSTIQVGGLAPGTTFLDFTLNQMFDSMFYPYTKPLISLTIMGNSMRELGSELGRSINLTYKVTPKSDLINSIKINGGIELLPSPTNSLIESTTTVIIPLNDDTSLNMTVLSGVGKSDSVSTPSITWQNSTYVFGIKFNTAYDLTTTPGEKTIIANLIQPSMSLTVGNLVVTNHSGVDVSSISINAPRSLLKTDKQATYLNIGSDDPVENNGKLHIAFAFPTAYGVPTFEVNGLINTAFTKVISNVKLKNGSGYALTSYDVWISNTPQNSTLSSIKIT